MVRSHRASHPTGPSQRQLRVGEALRHALAWALERGTIRDPALQGVVLTVTEVRMSPDLKHAMAFVMPLGGANGPDVVEGLNRVGGFLRHEVAKQVPLKFLPEYRFALDTSFDEGARIDALLRKPEVQRDLDAKDDVEDPEDGA
ncbi:MAG: 30S ribosome-binding factor RbfA [Alphaproteobacteria bacterium]|nr:30S ribosome-binding factor RbfA [Alphaproteobacteria bacterium]